MRLDLGTICRGGICASTDWLVIILDVGHWMVKCQMVDSFTVRVFPKDSFHLVL